MILIGLLIISSFITEVTYADSVMPAFSEKGLKILMQKENANPEDVRVYAKAFRTFLPTNATEITWCYELLNSPHVDRQTVFERITCNIHNKVYRDASREFLYSKDKKQFKMSLDIVLFVKDNEALPILRKIEKIDEEPYKRYNYNIRTVRAKLKDPELLKELTDKKKQTPDSTLAAMNRELLKEYGQEGYKALEKIAGTSDEADAQIDALGADMGLDVDTAKLVKEFKRTFSKQKKVNILWKLIAVNDANCQPLFEELLADLDALSDLDNTIHQDILFCRYVYLGQEVRKVQKKLTKIDCARVLKWTDHKSPLQSIKEGELEIALTLLKEMKSEKDGIDNAKALKKLTGQQFQYPKPIDFNYVETRKILRNSDGTPMAKEEVIAERDELLERMKKHYGEGVNYESTKSEIDQRYNNYLNELKKPALWEIGVPLDEAEQWLRTFYCPLPLPNYSSSQESDK